MIWILLLYVLPFFLSTILLYKFSKEDGETKGKYLLGVLLLLIPLVNILLLLVMLVEYLNETEIIESIKEYLKQPL